MNKNQHLMAALAMGIMSTTAWSVESLSDAFSEGDTNLSFRYRFELVDQDNFNRDANASTLRTRLNYKTAAYKGFSFFIEADNVMEVLVITTTLALVTHLTTVPIQWSLIQPAQKSTKRGLTLLLTVTTTLK